MRVRYTATKHIKWQVEDIEANESGKADPKRAARLCVNVTSIRISAPRGVSHDLRSQGRFILFDLAEPWCLSEAYHSFCGIHDRSCRCARFQTTFIATSCRVRLVGKPSCDRLRHPCQSIRARSSHPE